MALTRLEDHRDSRCRHDTRLSGEHVMQNINYVFYARPREQNASDSRKITTKQVRILLLFLGTILMNITKTTTSTTTTATTTPPPTTTSSSFSTILLPPPLPLPPGVALLPDHRVLGHDKN